jgi:hypothetical protein
MTMSTNSMTTMKRALRVAALGAALAAHHTLRVQACNRPGKIGPIPLGRSACGKWYTVKFISPKA